MTFEIGLDSYRTSLDLTTMFRLNREGTVSLGKLMGLFDLVCLTRISAKVIIYCLYAVLHSSNWGFHPHSYNSFSTLKLFIIALAFGG